MLVYKKYISILVLFNVTIIHLILTIFGLSKSSLSSSFSIFSHSLTCPIIQAN